MFGAEDALLCVKCPAVEGFSFVELGASFQDERQVVERGEGVGVFGAEDTLASLKCPAVEGLSFVEMASLL